MIIGIGTDLVDCDRIAGVYERFGQQFVDKILSISERRDFVSAASPVAFLAKRFAAKEAAAKALGVGIGGQAGLQEIIVIHDEQGAPMLEFCGKAARTAKARGVRAAHLSLSDEKQFALAFVVLSAP